MSAPLVPDALWQAIEPPLPKEQPKPRGGRRRGTRARRRRPSVPIAW